MKMAALMSNGYPAQTVRADPLICRPIRRTAFEHISPVAIPANHFPIAAHFEKHFRMSQRAAIARTGNAVVVSQDWLARFRVLGHIRQHPLYIAANAAWD